MDKKSLLQLRFGFALLVSTVVVGTVGYMLIERWDFIDSLYMTVITVTTTGFKEVRPLSDAGKIFTIFMIVVGVGSIAYTAGRAVQILFEADILRRRRMNKTLHELKEHFIVCGYGNIGKYVCEQLLEKHSPFVVIERDSDKIEDIKDEGYPFVEGDATDDDTLESAGVHRARGMVVVMGSDADNVFTTLSAKSLNPDIFVVARAIEEETEPKLLKAGAGRVVKPYEAAGTKMAEILLRPGVIEFIDIVTRDRTVDLNIQEMIVGDRSRIVDKNLAESPIRHDMNVIIAAINRRDGTFVFNPESSTVIHAGDRLIALGQGKNLEKLLKICEG